MVGREFVFLRTLILLYQGPIPTTSFNFNYSQVGPYFKYSDIGG